MSFASDIGRAIGAIRGPVTHVAPASRGRHGRIVYLPKPGYSYHSRRSYNAAVRHAVWKSNRDRTVARHKAARTARHARRIAAHRRRVAAKIAREAAQGRANVLTQSLAGQALAIRTLNQAEAKRRTQAAANRLPQQTRIPAVPLLKHYTPAQRHTVERLVSRASHGSGREFHQLSRNPDKQTRARLKAIRRAGRQEVQAREAQSYRRRVAAAHIGVTPTQLLQGKSKLTRGQRKRWREVQPLLKLYRSGRIPVDTRLGPRAAGTARGRNGSGSKRFSVAEQARRERLLEVNDPTSLRYMTSRYPHGSIRPMQKGLKEGGGTDLAFIHLGRGPTKWLGQHVLAVPLARGIGRFPGAQDVLNLPANAATGLYFGGAAAFEAARGDTTRAEALWRGFKETDPIALAVQGRFKEAGHEAVKHPLYTALEASAIGSVAGKAAGIGSEAGALTRGAVAGRSLRAGLRRRAKVLEREPRRLPGTTQEVPRRYSRNIATRRAQKTTDSARARSAAKLEQRAAEADRRGDPEAAQELRARAHTRSGQHMSEHEIRRATNELVAVNEDLRRRARSEAIRATGKVLPRRRDRQLVPLVAQGITKPTRSSVESYIAHLDSQLPGLKGRPALRLANRTLARRLRKALRSKRINWSAVQAAAKEYAAITRPLERHAVERGLFDAHEVAKAKAIPYAVRNMGARHDATGEARAVAREEESARELGVLEHDRLALEGKLRRATDPGTKRQLRAQIRRREAAQRKLQAERRRHVPGLVDAQGRPLTLDAIHTHMRKNGTDPDDIAFMPQAPNQRGPRNYFRSFYPRKGEPTRRRTGAATEKGTFDAHPSVLHEQAARLAGLVSADEGFQRFIRDFGQRDSEGGLIRGSRDDMEKLAADEGAKTGRRLRVIRLNPWLGRRQMLHKLLEEDDEFAAAGMPNRRVTETLKQVLDDEDPGPRDGEFTVVDATAAKHLRDHLDALGAGSFLKVHRLVNQHFRQTVLATRPTWLTGNVVEAALRTVFAQAGPKSYYIGRQLLGPKAPALDRAFAGTRLRPEQVPALVAEAKMRTVGGGHYAMVERQHVHTGAEQFRDSGPLVRRVAHALGTFWRTPGPKQVAGAWTAWTHLVFHHVNARAERQFQYALAGKYAKRHLMPESAMKVSQKAIDQAARGLTNTSEQAAMGRWIDRAYGKYGKFGPQTRKAIALYTPFVAWSLNAVRFVFEVLPRDHPVKAALASSMVVHTEEWRKQYGLDLFMKGAAPGFLQGSIPVRGSKVRISRYTPFGFFADPGDAIATVVLPQYGGSLMALRGLDWKGKPLEFDGEPANPAERFMVALDQFFGGTVPLYAQLEQGFGLDASSASKSAPDRIQGIINPFKPISPPKSKSSTDDPIDSYLKHRGDGGKPGGAAPPDDAVDQYLKERLGG